MNYRERFKETMHFGRPDRVPYWELGYWHQTLERWEDEGMPADAHREAHFGLDLWGKVPVTMGIVPTFREETIEETDRYLISRRWDGVITRALKEGTVGKMRLSMDQYIRFPVHDRASFQEFKKRLNPKSPARYPLNWKEYKRQVAERDYPLFIHAGSIYGWLRNWMGVENISMAIYDDRAWVEEMMEWVTDYIIQTITPALEQIPHLDGAIMWEDMCYKTGPLLSPKHFKEMMVPRYKRITGLLRKYGIDIVLLDSDGNLDALTPLWLEGGVNGLYPLEVAAGNDPVKMRKQYGKDLVLWGGIDKMALAKGKKAIEEEVMSKVPFLIEHGGWIRGVDHAVPPDVSYENFLYYLALTRKICEGK